MPTNRRLLWRFWRALARSVLLAIAALVVMFEETLIHWMILVMQQFARLPLVARVEKRLQRLGPYAAAFTFLVPFALIEPIKLAAAWLIAVGHARTGIILLVVGELAGTALLARLYQVLHPNLVRLPWFVRAENWVFGTRDWLYARLRAMPGWQAITRTVARIKSRAAARRIWLRRRFAAWHR